MEFKPRVPREDVNVSPTHPLREAATLVAGVTVVFGLALGLLAWSVDLLVTWIPAETEARVFGHLGPELAERPTVRGERVEAAREVLDRLAARWPDAPYPSFRLEVLESEDLNAAALPGGFIVVTSRLLDEVETENELAFVLGHELGHFRGRHHLRRLGRGAAWGLGLAVVGGTGNRVPGLASLVGGLTARGFDRDQEREADDFGLQLVQAEYGHVAEAADFLGRLDEGSRLVAYVSTHPASAERIAELRELAQTRGWAPTGPSVPLPASMASAEAVPRESAIDALGFDAVAAGAGPHLATGFKVGEVTADAAIVWVRTTRESRPNPPDRPGVLFRYADESAPRVPRREDQKVRVSEVVYPAGGADALPLAVPGTRGEVRVRYRAAGEPWQETSWQAVWPERDFTRQIRLAGLRAGTHYDLEVQSRRPGAREAAATLTGAFGTAPAADSAAPVLFTVVTGQNAFRTRDREDGFEIYRSMLALEPSFFVHTGDIVYYDRLGKTLDLARYHWQYTYGLPTNVTFHRRVPSYFIKDDHDVWQDDCWPGMRRDNMHELTFAQGQAVFREQVPMGERTWRTIRWGRDLQIWLVEGRDFRSPNDTPDGPDKTIWGAEQKAWFKETVAASDATFRVLVSPTPIVGPDRPSKRDNHSNSNFAHEGEELRSFISSQGNMIVICGDRHWQYASVDPKTGLREYSSGPHTDAHAGGFSEDQRSPMHRFLRIRGGFLSGTVERQDGAPTLTIRLHDVNGAVQYSERRRR